tara:strand:- start:11788 stop:12462 length:675 start_codon:yes stop_codon:yes gene_type:complete
MNMKRPLNILIRSLILEQVDELFVDPAAEEETTRLENDSADDQIDSFILKFEKDSIDSDDSESQSLNESLQNLSLRVLLEQEEEEVEDEPAFEAAEETEPAEVDVEAEEEVGPDDPEPADSADTDAEPAEALPKPPLDVDAFTKRVARLAMNHQTLLDIKTVIVNRAANFLKENYDDEHAQEMKDILDEQFDFDLDGGKEIPEAPFAVGANPLGAGAMGGGGGV